MNATRQDAWTEDEDILLAETVLRYIRKGKTQLEAFKEVAEQLSRTSAACGFRWNATIRKHYQEAIELAKEERKQGGANSLFNLPEVKLDREKDTIETAILLLEKMKTDFSGNNSVTQREQEKILNHLQKENKVLQEKVQRYENAWTEMGNLWSWVKEKNNV